MFELLSMNSVWLVYKYGSSHSEFCRDHPSLTLQYAEALIGSDASRFLNENKAKNILRFSVN